MPKNPFILTEIPTAEAFCDREKELADLVSYAHSNTNTVLFSPRRYGKTSLVKRVQEQLRKERFLTAYCDLFGVTSVEEIAARITKALFVVTQKRETVFKKAVSLLTSFRPVLAVNDRGEMSVSVQPAYKQAGLDTLEDTMQGLENFVGRAEEPIHVVLDEFQEITEIEKSESIEGIMRSYVQKIQCSFVFVGSRRRILLDMFNNRNRPFFQSAINYELRPIPLEELTDYIVNHFKKEGKSISRSLAERSVEQLNRHPGYVQKFCFFLFENTASKVADENMAVAHQSLLANEKNYFESILQGLTNRQVALLTAIAKEPQGKLYSNDFIARHNLGSTGGVQKSLSLLVKRDLVEKNPDSRQWFVVDPVLGTWLFLESPIA